MSFLTSRQPHRVILLAPIFHVLHVLEEAPSLVSWLNSLVAEGITQEFFLTVNAFGFLITVIVTAMLASSKEAVSILVAIVWLSFLMFANGLLHLVGTVVHSRYSPGAISSVVLYLPYFAWFVYLTLKQTRLRVGSVVLATAAGSVLMFWHGYLILFKGDRLF